MAIAFVQKAPNTAAPYEANTAAHVVSFGSLPTVGNFILVCIARDDSDSDTEPTSVADNQGNGNYTLAVKNADNQQIVYIYYKEAIANSSGTFTVTVSWSASKFANVGIAEFSGVKASSSLDDTNIVENAAVDPITTQNLDPATAALYVGVTCRNASSDLTSVTADQNSLWYEASSANATMASAYRIGDGSALPVTWTYAAALATNTIGATFVEESVAADKPIWEFTELTAPAVGDLLAIIDDPSGTETTKKITIANLFKLFVSDVTLAVLTGSGTYSPPAGTKKQLIFVVGGGGGGGGGLATDSAGGGGQGGGTAIKLVATTAITNGAYVVGGGGNGASSGGASAAGTSSTFNIDGSTTITGTGGSAGTSGSTSTTVGVQTAGGSAAGGASNGDLNIPGKPGGLGVQYSGSAGSGGMGGDSVFGFGGTNSASNAAGSAAGAYGSGGGGGQATGATDQNGAAGAAGTIFILEFYG